jgi:hypothetical protein
MYKALQKTFVASVKQKKRENDVVFAKATSYLKGNHKILQVQEVFLRGNTIVYIILLGGDQKWTDSAVKTYEEVADKIYVLLE